MAVPRTSVEAPATTDQPPRRDGLSLQTLITAAVASGVAAIIVSHLWDKGTIAASAMTPVIVAIVSEGLKKPVQSDLVRGSVRAASSTIARPRSGRTPTVIAPPRGSLDEELRQREEGLDAGPVRVYSTGSNRRSPLSLDSPRRQLHLKLAVITGLVAFVIAAAALTLPELIFGGSVTGGHRTTTYFGGGTSSKDEKKAKDSDSSGGSSSSSSQDQDSPDSTTPKSPSDSGSDQPSDTTPSSPDQTAPTETQPPTSESTTPQAPATPSTPTPTPTP